MINYKISKINNYICSCALLFDNVQFGTRQIGKSIDYLTSETVPVCSSKRGIKGFFSKYGELCKAA